MKQANRVTMPVLLIGCGIVLLIGCIPIPATRQFQPDGSLRPEYAIGRNKPIEIGKTHIDDARAELNGRITSAMPYSDFQLPTSPLRQPAQWAESLERQQFAVKFDVRSATYPLCFFAQAADPRWLLLDVDSSGIVRGVKTVKEPPEYWKTR